MPKLIAVTLLAGLLAAQAARAQTAPTVEHAWARATVAAVKTGAAYLTITGHGAADVLLSAATPVADRAELHEAISEGNVMRMRPVERLMVPVSASVVLTPGGTHVMLVGLKGPLTVGQHFPLTLVFQDAGKLEADVVVAAAGAARPMEMNAKH